MNLTFKLIILFTLLFFSSSVNAQCTTMLKASLTSFFTNLNDKLAIVTDRVELCEMCIRVTKYAYLLSNHPSSSSPSSDASADADSSADSTFQSSVASHACSSYHEHREDDCLTLSHAIVHQSDYADAQFSPAELNLSVEDLRTLIVSKADQRCAELSCCGSKIFRRQFHPTTNGQLQPEDIDAEASALSKQEMELVNQRAAILQEKMSLDDRIAQLRRDASFMEKTKQSIRLRRQRLNAFEHRLKHREERLSEKEEDLAERQKLTPYYLPYPLTYPAQQQQAPPPQQQQQQQTSSSDSNSNSNSNSNSSPPPASSLQQRASRPSSDDLASPSDYDLASLDYDGNSDGLQELSDEEENNFLSLIQGVHAERRASPHSRSHSNENEE